jgi:hypothetical protein
MNNRSKEISHFITRSVYFAAFIIIVLIATLLPIKMILAAQITNHETVIENIKEKLVAALQKVPLEIKSTAWIDESGTLQETTKFESEAKINGIRIENYSKSEINLEYLDILKLNDDFNFDCDNGKHIKYISLIVDKKFGLNYPAFNSVNITDYFSSAIISSFNNGHFKITKSKRNFDNEYQRSLLDISDSNPSYSLLYKIEEFDNNVDSEDAIYKTINSEKKSKIKSLFSKIKSKELSKTHDFKLNLFLFDNLSKELIYESSYPFKLDILLTNESFYPSIDPTSLNTIKTKIKDFSIQVQKRISCYPTQFQVEVENSDIIINAGKNNNISIGDKILIVDTNYLPKKIFDDSKSLEKLILAEVVSLENFKGKLQIISKKKDVDFNSLIGIPL